VSRSTRGNSPRCRDRGDRRPPRTPRVRRRRARRRDRRPEGTTVRLKRIRRCSISPMRTRSLDGNSRTCSPTTSRRRRFGSALDHRSSGGWIRFRVFSKPMRHRRSTSSSRHFRTPIERSVSSRDRRGSRGAALSSIRRALVALRRAETPSAVRDATTAAVRELAGADVAVWYRAEDDRFRPATGRGGGAHRWRQALARAATDRSRREPAVRCSRERRSDCSGRR